LGIKVATSSVNITDSANVSIPRVCTILAPRTSISNAFCLGSGSRRRVVIFSGKFCYPFFKLIYHSSKLIEIEVFGQLRVEIETYYSNIGIHIMMNHYISYTPYPRRSYHCPWVANLRAVNLLHKHPVFENNYVAMMGVFAEAFNLRPLEILKTIIDLPT
jgi:hypothetical protein